MRSKRHDRQAISLHEVSTVCDEHYPTLHVIHTTPTIVVRGVFPVLLEQQHLGQFLVEIVVGSRYPAQPPDVKEIGGRIPHNMDRHVFPNTCDLCLFLPDERWKYWGVGDGFESFLRNPLNDYFLGQLYFERYGRFPFGERRHGVTGILDFYSEELETQDIQVILRGLQYLGVTEIKGHWPCYCGSGKLLRYCHGPKIRALHSKIPPSLARARLVQILKSVRG